MMRIIRNILYKSEVVMKIGRFEFTKRHCPYCSSVVDVLDVEMRAIQEGYLSIDIDMEFGGSLMEDMFDFQPLGRPKFSCQSCKRVIFYSKEQAKAFLKIQEV